MPVLKRAPARGEPASQRSASAAADGRRAFGGSDAQPSAGSHNSYPRRAPMRPHSARDVPSSSSSFSDSRWARTFHGAPSNGTSSSRGSSNSCASQRSPLNAERPPAPGSYDSDPPPENPAADIGVAGIKYNDSARHYSRRLSESKILAEAISQGGVTNSVPEKCSSISALDPRGDSLFQDLDGTVFSTTRDFPGVILASRSPVAKRSCPDKLNLVNKGLSDCCLLEEEHRLKSLSYKQNKIRRVGALQMRATPNLVLLDLGDNCLERVEGMEALASLRILMLGNNALRSAVGLAALRLDVLDLHDNLLEDTGGIEGQKALRVLNLSGNNLAALGDLSRLSYLVQLNARRNRLAEIGTRDTVKGAGRGSDKPLAAAGGAAAAATDAAPTPKGQNTEGEDGSSSPNGFSEDPPPPPLSSAEASVTILPVGLERLYMSHNLFADVGALRCIGAMRNLTELALDGCPLCSSENVRQYREVVLELCEHLGVLDMQNVRDEERRHARNAKARREELLQRSATLRGIRAAWEHDILERSGSADERRAARPLSREGSEVGEMTCSARVEKAKGRSAVLRQGKGVLASTPPAAAGLAVATAEVPASPIPPSGSPHASAAGHPQKKSLVEASGPKLSLYGAQALVGASQLSVHQASTTVLHMQFVQFDCIPFCTLARALPNIRELSLEDNAMDRLNQVAALRPLSNRLRALRVGESNRVTRLALFAPYALYVMNQLELLNGLQVAPEELATAQRSFTCVEETLRRRASGSEETSGAASLYAPDKSESFNQAADALMNSARRKASKTELLNTEWSHIIRSIVSGGTPPV